MDASWNMGYKKGQTESKIHAAMNMLALKSKKYDIRKGLKEAVANGIFTEFQRQQALFFLRMGMQQDKKRRRKKKEYSEKEKIII